MKSFDSVWSEADILELRGQAETIRLEFKSGRLLDDENWIDALSKEASGLANAEGGVLILGIREDRSGKVPVAGDPDGVLPSILGRDQLVKKVEGNLSPYPRWTPQIRPSIYTANPATTPAS